LYRVGPASPLSDALIAWLTWRENESDIDISLVVTSPCLSHLSELHMKIRFLLPLCSLLVAGCSSIEKSTDPERDYEILQRKQQAEAVKRFESPTS
jgi:hypothetical protein